MTDTRWVIVHCEQVDQLQMYSGAIRETGVHHACQRCEQIRYKAKEEEREVWLSRGEQIRGKKKKDEKSETHSVK